MSVAQPFLRGGRPVISNLNDLVERLHSAADSTTGAGYKEWLWVCYFPRQWCHEAKYNRTRAPVFHALLGRHERAGRTEPAQPPHQDDKAEWHLLLTFCQADAFDALAPYTRARTTVDLAGAESAAASLSSSSSASPLLATLDGATTLLDVMDRLMQYLPLTVIPSRCTFAAAVEGRTHEKLGLFSTRRWVSCVEAVRKRCSQRLTARCAQASLSSPAEIIFGEAHIVRDWTSVTPLSGPRPSESEEASSAWLHDTELIQTVRGVLEWLCAAGPSHGLPLSKDASLPILAAHEQTADDAWYQAFTALLDTALTISPLLWTATFCEFGEGRSDGVEAEAKTEESVERVKGIAKLRAQRDAAREQWRDRVGRCTTFSVPCATHVDPLEGTVPSSAMVSADAGPQAADKGVLFRHALLLQKRAHAPERSTGMGGNAGGSGVGTSPGHGPASFSPANPIATAASTEGLSLDADDVQPLPIGAQLHLYPDRGDAVYVESVGLRNTQGAVLDLNLDDYLHEEGEILVQLGPVEGIPFAALDAFLRRCEAHSAATDSSTPAHAQPAVGARVVDGKPLTTLALLHAALEENGEKCATPLSSVPSEEYKEGDDTTQTVQRWLPPLCEGSRSRLMYPRVLFRHPTGTTAKQNPIARAHAGVHVEAPSVWMLVSAARALSYLSAHAHEVESSTHHAVSTTPLPSAQTRPHYTPLTLSRYTLGPSPADITSASSTGANCAKSGQPTLESTSQGSAVAGRRCAWCGRARERLLRCSGCRAVYYCCPTHQTLDWKSGSHKSECTLFLHAQILQERVLAPLVRDAIAAKRTEQGTHDGEQSGLATATTELTPHLSVGWSFAASTVAFVETLPGPMRSGLPQCVHVVGVDHASVDGFLCALGSLVGTVGASDDSVGSVRLLLCVADLPSARHNEVWACDRSTATSIAAAPTQTRGQMRLLAETGVLGDVWRQGEAQPLQTHTSGDMASRPSSSSSCAWTVRLINAAYHVWHDKAGADALTHVSARPPSSAVPLSYSAADGVLIFSPLDGNGLNYLTASLETIAEHYIHRRAVRGIDSTYIGCIRTQNALAARVLNNDRLPSTVRTLVERSRHTVPAVIGNTTTASADATTPSPKKEKTIDLTWDVCVNSAGFGPDAVLRAQQEAETAGSEAAAAGRRPVAPSLNVVNGFFFDVRA